MFKSNKERQKSTVKSIQSVTCAFQPKVNVSEVLDDAENILDSKDGL